MFRSAARVRLCSANIPTRRRARVLFQEPIIMTIIIRSSRENDIFRRVRLTYRASEFGGRTIGEPCAPRAAVSFRASCRENLDDPTDAVPRVDSRTRTRHRVSDGITRVSGVTSSRVKFALKMSAVPPGKKTNSLDCTRTRTDVSAKRHENTYAITRYFNKRDRRTVPKRTLAATTRVRLRLTRTRGRYIALS